MSPGVDAAIEQYRRAFERDPAAHKAAVSRALAGRGLGALPTLIRPAFIDAADRSFVAEATLSLHSALEKVGRAYFRDGRFADEIRLTPRAADLARIDAGPGPLLGLTRYDAVFEPRGRRLSFLEVQAGDPSGMGYSDAILEAFLELPATRAVADRFAVASDPLVPSQRAALLERYARFRRERGLPPRGRSVRIAFAPARESTVLADHVEMARRWREAGHDAFLADPRDFAYDGRTLAAADGPVDLVFRDTVDEWLCEPYGEGAEPLIRACRDGRVCLANPLSSIFADFKATFAVLSDPASEDLFDPDERRVLREHVPWTRLLTPALAAEALAQKDAYVLKPNDGWGGFGVVVGRDAPPDAWEATLAKALASEKGYVLQRYVDPTREEYPTFDGAGPYLAFVPKNVTTSFWVHDGRFAGSFVRAADASVVNVHQGGGIMPTLFVGAGPGSLSRAAAPAS